jgi:hypothetical protein
MVSRLTIPRLAILVVRQRRMVLLLFGLLTLVAACISLQLQFDFTPQALFAGQHDLVEFNEQTKQTFGHTDNIMLVVQTVTGQSASNKRGHNGQGSNKQEIVEHDMLTPAALNWHVKVCQHLRKLPGIERIDALATLRMPRHRLLGRSSLRLIPVIRHIPVDVEEADLVRRKIDDQPLLNGALVSADRRTLAIVLHLDPTAKDYQHLKETARRIEQVIEKVPPQDGFDMFLGGLPAMRVEIVNNLRQDQLIIIPLCVIAFALIDAILFRCWAGILIPAVAVLVGLVWTLAAMVLLNQPLTILSNILPVLLMIVGVSTCVHFLSCYAEQSELHPHDREQAVYETVRHIALACFLTSLTTALGFLSLMFAHSQLLEALGWQAAMGIGFYYVATMGCCAALAPYFSAPRASRWHSDPHRSLADQQSVSPLARGAWVAGRLATEHSRLTVLAGLLAIAGAIIVSQHTEINSLLAETFDDDNPQIERMRLIENQLGGFMPMEVVFTAESAVDSPNPEIFQRTGIWHRLVAFDRFVHTRPEVLFSRSLVDFYRQVDRLLPGGPQLNQFNQPGQKMTEYQTERLEIRLQEIHHALKRQAKTTGYPSYLSADRRQTRMLLRMRDHGTHQDREFASVLQQQLALLFPPGHEVRYQITGEAYVAAIALNRFIHDLFLSLVCVSLFIFLVIGLLLRSPRLGLISILPNITPLAITMGYLGLRGYSLSMSNVIVFAISLGVAVDNTIHFLARFREEWELGQIHGESDVMPAIRRTCLGTGRAILMTTILIVCGLAILLLSAFVPTRRFAELSTVTMVSALLGDLLLLPASLKLFWPRRHRSVMKQSPDSTARPACN